MGRLAWSQLRFRGARTIALLAGMLLAATAFTVLTAPPRTSQLRSVGTVTAHFSPAYDILVRPKGSRSALEARTGTVQPNFLSGIYGGISLAQYHRIERIPGVQVAAPIAMVGYTLIRAGIPVLLPSADNSRPGRQLYRYATSWVSAGGTTRVPPPVFRVPHARPPRPDRGGRVRRPVPAPPVRGGRGLRRDRNSDHRRRRPDPGPPPPPPPRRPLLAEE